jgi:hypothetical protein
MNANRNSRRVVIDSIEKLDGRIALSGMAAAFAPPPTIMVTIMTGLPSAGGSPQGGFVISMPSGPTEANYVYPLPPSPPGAPYFLQ